MISKLNTKLVCVIFGVVFLTLYSLSFGQVLGVKSAFEKDTIQIADQTTLVYSFEKPDSVKIKIPTLEDTTIGNIVFMGEPILDSSALKGNISNMSLKLLVTAFDTGLFHITPQAFVFTGDFSTDTLYSDSITLKVLGVALDSSIRDIKAPYAFKKSKDPGDEETLWAKLKKALIYIIPALILVALAYFLFKYLKEKRPASRVFQSKIEEEPPYITAFRELDRIKAQKLWQQRQVKEYYTRITHVIRWYIDKRYHINALEQTSDQILGQLKKHKLNDVNFSKLSELLNLADLVKFAKGEPNPEDNLTHLENAYKFIQITRTDLTDPAVDEISK